jgi:hypothetical protein
MWWRALGVAVVLLCAGVAGGYAVADHRQDRPVGSDTLVPVPAQSPSIPLPPEQTYLPDPGIDPLAPGLPSTPRDLRVSGRGLGVRVNVPDGWRESQISDTTTWTFTGPDNLRNTYTLRINLNRNLNVSATAAQDGRIAAMQESDANPSGDIKDLKITTDAGDAFEATYVSGGYFRVTMEKFVSFDGSHSYAEVAVTGRVPDTEGMRDLLTRTVDSMVPLPPKEKQPK